MVPPPRFTAVIDAGSSGSRLYLYEFSLQDDGVPVLRGKPVMKVTPGLSSFIDNPEAAADYLLPLFLAAGELIPKEYHASTHIFIKSTAGMRLIPEEAQHKIYDRIFDDLTHESSELAFRLKRKHIGTIDGGMEAYYAVLSTNYLEGRIDARLQPTGHKGGVLGALDMGGASTQIIFTPQDALIESTEERKTISPEHFWGNSFLSYGVEVIRERVWDHLVMSHTNAGSGAGNEMVVANPCTFVGHVDEWKGYALIGVGNSSLCTDTLKHVIWGDEHVLCIEGSCSIDGVRVPDVAGDFFAMSVFFYGMDCVRELGLVSGSGGELNAVWPRPSVGELMAAVDEFCSMDWSMINETLLDVHSFTQPEWLPYRCVEAVYMVTLLRDGYGFPADSRNITFALEANGMEVEWTLGFALEKTAQKSAEAAAEEAARAAAVGSVEIIQQPTLGGSILLAASSGDCSEESTWPRLPPSSPTLSAAGGATGTAFLAIPGDVDGHIARCGVVVISFYALMALLSWRRGLKERTPKKQH